MDSLINYDSVALPTSVKYRLRDPRDIAHFKELTEKGVFGLSESEKWWRDHYDILLANGYRLRPRYHPDWKPSWLGTDVTPGACEDALQHSSSDTVMDAKRIKDGTIVAIKYMYLGYEEARLSKMLSSPERLQDPTNHCVPILDHFTHDSSGLDFLVMPLLRRFSEPPFHYVDEVLDFIQQTLEGLEFMHSQGVAHRDLSDGNIMMEGRSLYVPDGFHPSFQDRTARDCARDAVPRKRIDVCSDGLVKYYIIDFGESSYFEEPNKSRLVTGDFAQDRDVPELSERVPYDPFPVDVFTLAMVYKRNFFDKYANFAFLLPLIERMTQQVPTDRPTAKEAFEHYSRILKFQSGPALRWHLLPVEEHGRRRLSHNARSMAREVQHWTRSRIKSNFGLRRAFLNLVSPFTNAYRTFLNSAPA